MTRFFQLIILILCLHFYACQSNSSHKADDATQKDTLKPKCAEDNESITLGIGLVMAHDSVNIFTDSLLREKFLSWEINKDEEPPKGVCPKYYSLEYGMMHFVCIGKTDKFYRVLVNTSEIEFLPVSKTNTFTTWQDYILNSFGIRRNISSENKNIKPDSLRESPDPASKIIPVPKGHEMFCAMEVKEDWVKVKYDCFYNQENPEHEGEPCQSFIGKCKNPVTGWLRWREGNKVLIDIMQEP